MLEEVNRTGEPVEILEQGRPVARLMPPPPPPPRKGRYLQETLRGTVKYFGDILEPVLPEVREKEELEKAAPGV